MPLEIGLVGIGDQMNKNLLPSILNNPQAEVVALAESDPKRRHSLLPAMKNAKPFADPIEMLEKSPGLKALVMASYPEVHFKVACEAMDRGIAVFVEKPPCENRSELLTLIDVANKKQVVNGVGMNFRFAKPIVAVRELLATSRYGQPLIVEVNHKADKPRAPLWNLTSTLRSLLLAQSIHAIDLAIQFGGDELVAVRPVVLDSNQLLIVQAGLDFRNGGTATVLTVNNAPAFSCHFSVLTNKSTEIKVDNLGQLVVHSKKNRNKRCLKAANYGPLDSGYERTGYYPELDQFFQAVIAGRRFAADFASLAPTYEVIEILCEVETKAGGGDSADKPAGLPSLSFLNPTTLDQPLSSSER